MNPRSTSSELASDTVVFDVDAFRVGLLTVDRETPFNRFTGNLRAETSGVELRVSIPSSEESPSNLRLFDLTGESVLNVEVVRLDPAIPNPKLRAGGG